jgi:hypothetical protein
MLTQSLLHMLRFFHHETRCICAHSFSASCLRDYADTLRDTFSSSMRTTQLCGGIFLLLRFHSICFLQALLLH